MATSKPAKLKADSLPAPVSLNELGYLGLKVVYKTIMEEADNRLRFPRIIREIDEMKKDSMVAAALHLYHMMISKPDWKVVAPIGASAKTIERANFVQECMHDMEHSWQDFISEVCSFVDYGFAINEIVFRRRLKENGSKYNDGLIGLRKLPPRSQSTITGWVFSDDGRELLYVEQSLRNLTNQSQFEKLIEKNGTDIRIPRKKFLLFNTDPQHGNPEGTACLKASWVAWQYKKIVQDSEMLGISRDLQGVPLAKIPARFLSNDASPEDKAVGDYVKNLVRNMQNGQQAGVVLPSDSDPESRLPLFELQLLQSNGSKGYDTTEILKRYNAEILVTLYADLLQLGNTGSGSFALANSKTNIIGFAVEHRLREIKRVLDSHLMRAIFEANGWELDELPEFVYTDLDDVDLAEFSSAVQRIVAVGAIEQDRAFFNMTRQKFGLKPFAEDEPVHYDEVPQATSRSGDSFNTASGGLNGTSNSVSTQDNSVANKANNTV